MLPTRGPMLPNLLPTSAKRLERSDNADSRFDLFSSRIVTISNSAKRVQSSCQGGRRGFGWHESGAGSLDVVACTLGEVGAKTGGTNPSASDGRCRAAGGATTIND